jgi:hypothetical protein
MQFSKALSRFLSALTLTMAVLPAHADPVVAGLPSPNDPGPAPIAVAPAPVAAPAPLVLAAGGKVNLDQLSKSLFPEDNAPLAFEQIVIPLEGFLIQRILDKAAKFFDKDDVFTVKNARGEVATYVMAPNIRDLLNFLKDKKYKIVVVSGLDSQAATQAMASIQLVKGSPATLASIAKLGEMDWTEKINLKDFGNVQKTIAIAYEGMAVTPADQVIKAGPYYVPFTTFEAMNANRVKTGEDAQYYAPDAKTWEAERYKVARVLFSLKETNKNSKAVFQAKLAEVNKTSPEILSRNGRQYTDGKWNRLKFTWKLSADKKKVEGCEVQDKISSKPVQAAAIENCTESLGTRAQFVFDKKAKTVTSCDVMNTDGALVERGSSPTKCVQGLKGITYATDFRSKQCAGFTEDGFFISTVQDVKRCGDTYVIFDNGAKYWQTFQAFPGMEKLSEKALLQRVSWGWDPRTPLKYPESLVSMLISSEPNKINQAISAECIAAVKKHMNAGGNLASKKIIENSLVVEKFPRADVADNDFFHYTGQGSSFEQIRTQKSYSDFFSYLRKGAASTWNWVLYVAGDDRSSQSYGGYGYKFTFKPGTRIFYSQGDKPGVSSNKEAIESEVTAELVARNPELQNCNSKFNDSYLNFLVYLSAEASKVGAVAYWGIGNSVPGAAGAGSQWLQVLDAWSLQSMDRIR